MAKRLTDRQGQTIERDSTIRIGSNPVAVTVPITEPINPAEIERDAIGVRTTPSGGSRATERSGTKKEPSTKTESKIVNPSTVDFPSVSDAIPQSVSSPASQPKSDSNSALLWVGIGAALLFAL